jgi:hypothetical protein
MAIKNRSLKKEAVQLLSCTIQKAIHIPELHKTYLAGQREALAGYGLSNLVPAEFSDEELENTYLVAFYDNYQMLGGVKINIRTIETPLPVEKLISQYPSLHRLPEKLDKLATTTGVCEMGSLWAAKIWGGRFLSTRMIKTASDFAFNLGIGVCLGFIGPAINSALRAGFVHDTSFEAVAYPDDRFQSQVVWRFKKEKWLKEYGLA